MTVAIQPGFAERAATRLAAPVRWLGRSRLRRRTARVLTCALVAVGLVWFWAGDQFLGVPDVGDPFNIKAAGTVPVPDDRNAFVRYRDALSLLTRFKGRPRDAEEGRWAEVGPEVRAWVDANRGTLETWREGTDRPEALYHQPGDLTPQTPLPVTNELHAFARLAALHGSRLEEQGDMAGAWTWYRAILRSSRHSGSHAVIVERLVGIALHKTACRELMRWAADPRTDAALLRRALNEAIAIDARTVPVSETLKVEYLMTLRGLTGDVTSIAQSMPVFPARSQPEGWYYYVGPTRTAMLSLTRDRERSRRVVRLFFTNWLAHCDQPRRSRREAADLTNRAPLVYLPDPSSPPAAHALTPEAMARAYESTFCARAMLPTMDNFERQLAFERLQQARLVVGLAEQLHLRERGALPRSVEELVGTYLDRVPEEYQPEPPAAVLGGFAR